MFATNPAAHSVVGFFLSTDMAKQKNTIEVITLPVQGLEKLPPSEIHAAVRRLDWSNPVLVDAVTNEVARSVERIDNNGSIAEAVDELTDWLRSLIDKYIPRWLRPFMGRIDNWVDKIITEEGKALIVRLLLKTGRTKGSDS